MSFQWFVCRMIQLSNAWISTDPPTPQCEHSLRKIRVYLGSIIYTISMRTIVPLLKSEKLLFFYPPTNAMWTLFGFLKTVWKNGCSLTIMLALKGLGLMKSPNRQQCWLTPYLKTWSVQTFRQWWLLSYIFWWPELYILGESNVDADPLSQAH